VGTLPQLIIGAITDCLKGSPQAVIDLDGIRAGRSFAHYFRFTAPMSRYALGRYCIILVAVMFVKGFFSVLDSAGY